MAQSVIPLSKFVGDIQSTLGFSKPLTADLRVFASSERIESKLTISR